MQHILPALVPLVETARVDYTPATTGEEYVPKMPHNRMMRATDGARFQIM